MTREQEEQLAKLLEQRSQNVQLEVANAVQELGAIGALIRLEVARAKLGQIMDIQEDIAAINPTQPAAPQEEGT